VHADGLAANVQACGSTIIGAVEPDPDARSAWSASPLMELDELLAASEAVIVAGTNRERVDGVLAACAAGLPVLTEKPVAADAAELARLLEHADQSLVMVALPVRFAQSLKRARQLVSSGAIGDPIAARGTNHGQFPGGWFGSRSEAGGGALQDHVVHLSDALCWLLDDHVTHAYARASQVMHPANDVEDCGVVTLDFASGVFASIDASWSRPESFPTWGDVWLELVGTAGRLRIDPMATHLEVFDDSAGKLRHVGYGEDDMTLELVRSFLDFAAHRPPAAPVSFAEGVHASDVVFASYASAASGRREPVTSRH
jgi:predicted dehydrogenase